MRGHATGEPTPGVAHDDDHDEHGTEIVSKDWSSGEPIIFSHGWPLSADDRDSGSGGLGAR
jgi:hypothetical protein